jgi:hypothetical protein
MRYHIMPLLLATCAGLCAADLEWQPRQRDLQVRAGEKTLHTTYRLLNHTEMPVQVTSLRATCGCGQVRIEDEQVAAGADTTLHLDYNLGDRVGEHRHLILVETRQDDAEPQQHRLGINISIPEPVRLSRSVAFWRKGGPSKAIDITIDTAEGVTVTGVEAPDAVQAALSDPQEQTRTLRLTPNSTITAAHEQCWIVTTSADERFARVPITILIK